MIVLGVGFGDPAPQKNHHIIEKWCNSRITFIDDFAVPYKNGGNYIMLYLKLYSIGFSCNLFSYQWFEI